MGSKLLSLCGAVVVAAAIVAPGSAAPPQKARPSAAPVASLTPAATAKLWRKLVDRPRTFSVATDCRPVRAVFYAGTDWLRLATKLAANASPCAQYYISVPPLVGDKTQPRADQAWRIRALGPQFHALAEAHVAGWSGWVANGGGTWYDAGVEMRRRMAAAGYDVTLGDSWVVNELSSAVRQGAASARTNMRAFVRGLYDGDGSVPSTRGAVFITGMGQATSELSVYQARLQDWLEDAPFWNDMAAYVTDFSQELYGDVRNYAVPGADAAARRDSLNDYLQHEISLARVAPDAASAARSFLETAYNPLANAAWQYDAAFGWTNIPYDLMQHYVSAQTYALRYAGNTRFGLAWAPKNLNAMPSADFTAQTDALLERLAASIADSSSTPEAACGGTWCGGDLAGAAFNHGWQTFAAWKPSQLAFASEPQTVVAGSPSAAFSVELRTHSGIAYTTGLPVSVTLSSSSAGGAFATSAEGPWATTLTVSIASGSSTIGFHYRDDAVGTAVVSAAAAGKVAGTQPVTVTAPPATDTTPPETAISSAPAGMVASSSATVSFASDDAGASFQCSLDGAAYAACTSPASYSALADGAHVFDVRAVDAAGNADPTPARASWTVDTTAPDTRLTSYPEARTGSRTATFSFVASESDAVFQCSLDGGAYAACTSQTTYSGLSRGWHTFRVRALDAVGNADASPASYTWRIK